MNLSEILKAVDSLTLDERRQLRSYLERDGAALRAGTMDIDIFLRAAADLTDDMTDEEVKNMIDAMNEEYIEPWDESEWKD